MIAPARREPDQQLDAVGLYLRLVRGAVAVKLAAFGATVNDHVPLFGVGLYAHGLHLTAALVCAVARIDINVQRPQTKRAMVARGVAQRLDRLSAMRANESVVVFCKPFLLHGSVSLNKDYFIY